MIKNKLKSNKTYKKGFTMAELLVVVAIIMILMGFSFVQVQRYQKRLKRVELDNIAREIYVAAQNHMSAAQATGTWKGYVASNLTESGDKAAETLGTADTADAGTYYAEQGIKINNRSKKGVLDLILPPSAVDETVLSGGKYYVHYNPSTATVLDVYYAEGKKENMPSYDELKSSAAGEDKLSYRESNAVGWYGAPDIEVDNEKITEAQKTLQNPIVTVRNAESLVLYIIDPNVKNFDDAQVTLHFTGETAGEKTTVLKRNGDRNLNLGSPAAEPLAKENVASVERKTGDDTKVVLPDGTESDDYLLYTIILDNITRKGMHFANLFSDFIPGENITITATVTKDSSTDATEAADTASSTITTNSLFGSRDAENNSVTISNARHLENLSSDISKVTLSGITANLTDDLVWETNRRANPNIAYNYTGSSEAFWNAIFAANVKYGYDAVENPNAKDKYVVYPADGEDDQPQERNRKFSGIEAGSVAVFNGFGHTLTGFDMVEDFAASGSASAGAGLFAGTRADGITINDLVIKNSRAMTVDGTNKISAGTVVGHATGNVTLNNVRVIASYGSGYELGVYTFGSTGSNLNTAAQAIGVYSASGAAGGLVGQADGTTTITDSFASVPVQSMASEEQNMAAGGLVGSMAGGSIKNSFTGGYVAGENNDYTATTINVAAPNGAAGGLVGKASAALTTENAYSTASVSAKVGGGFIGSAAANLTVKASYATGRVYATSENAANSGKFAGTVAGDITATNITTDVKSGVMAGVSGTNADASNYSGLTFPSSMVSDKTASDLADVSATDLAEAAGNNDFDNENQETTTAVLTYSYQNGLTNKDYPYKTFTLSVAGSTANFANIAPNGKTKTYTVGQPMHYGDWPVLEAAEANLAITNDAVLYVDVKVPADYAAKGKEGAMTIVVVGETSHDVQFFTIKKKNAEDEPTPEAQLTVSRKENGYFGQSYYHWGADYKPLDATDKEQHTHARISKQNGTTSGLVTGTGDIIYRFYLDDVTSPDGHFTQVCPNLIAGENIKVFAVQGKDIHFEEQELFDKFINVTVPAEATANSLYATGSTPGETTPLGNANITNGRHLQNLDTTVSTGNQEVYINGGNSVTGKLQVYFNKATLKSDIDWRTTFKDHVAVCKETDNSGVGEDIQIYTHDGKKGRTNAFLGIDTGYWKFNNSRIGIDTFDGNGHTIENLYIDNSAATETEKNDVTFSDGGKEPAGLFRNAVAPNGISIHDLTLKNISSKGKIAAGLVAYTHDDTKYPAAAIVSLSNVKVNGVINIESSTNEQAAVLIAETVSAASTTISQTTVEGFITVKGSFAAGFVAQSGNPVRIENSMLKFSKVGDESDGSIVGKTRAAGLIADLYNNSLTILNSSVLSDDSDVVIQATDGGGKAGGLVAAIYTDLTIKKSVVAGKNMTVLANGNGSFAGGLVGDTGKVTIEDSGAAVYVEANQIAGGLAGNLPNGTVTRSYVGGHTVDGDYEETKEGNGRYNVMAPKNGTSQVGGFIGYASGNLSIDNCYSTASVYGDVAGGFMGENNSSVTITNSYATGLVSGKSNAGQFIGKNDHSYTSATNYYLDSMNVLDDGTDMPAVGNKVTNNKDDGNKDKVKNVAEPREYATMSAAGSVQRTVAYDGTLKGSYPFKTVAKAPTGVYHYGDWPSSNRKYSITFVTYDENGNEVRTRVKVSADTAVDWTKVNVPTDDPDNFTEFRGWYTDTEHDYKIPDSDFNKVSRNFVAYARVSEYVIFHSTDFEKTPSEEVTNKVYVKNTNNQKTVTPPVASSYLPDDDGYVFEGWYPDAEGKGNKYEVQNNTIVLNAPGHIYAKYELLGKYTVTVNFVDSTEQHAQIAEPFVYEISKKENWAERQINLPGIQNANPVNLLDTNGETVSSSEAVLSEDKTKLVIKAYTSKEDKTFNVVYSGTTISYKVKHVFKDTKYGNANLTSANNDVFSDAALQYNKGTNYTITETKQGYWHGRTDASALELPSLKKAGFEHQTIINKDLTSTDIEVTINYVRNSFVVSYETNGGEYLRPEALAYNAPVEIPTEITRKGYTLSGWTYSVTKTDESQVVDEYDVENALNMPAYDITLKAEWTPETTATVRVEFYQQRSTDAWGAVDKNKTYDFQGSASLTAKTGSILTEKDLGTLLDKDFDTDTSAYYRFHINKANTFYKKNLGSDGTALRVEADGSTVFKVYYDRDIMVIDFHYKDTGHNTQKYIVKDATTEDDWVTDSNNVNYGKYGHYKASGVFTEIKDANGNSPVYEGDNADKWETRNNINYGLFGHYEYTPIKSDYKPETVYRYKITRYNEEWYGLSSSDSYYYFTHQLTDEEFSSRFNPQTYRRWEWGSINYYTDYYEKVNTYTTAIYNGESVSPTLIEENGTPNGFTPNSNYIYSWKSNGDGTYTYGYDKFIEFQGSPKQQFGVDDWTADHKFGHYAQEFVERENAVFSLRDYYVKGKDNSGKYIYYLDTSKISKVMFNGDKVSNYREIETWIGLYDDTFERNNLIWPSKYKWSEYLSTNSAMTLTFLSEFKFSAISSIATYLPLFGEKITSTQQTSVVKHYIEVLNTDKNSSSKQYELAMETISYDAKQNGSLNTSESVSDGRTNYYRYYSDGRGNLKVAPTTFSPGDKFQGFAATSYVSDAIRYRDKYVQYYGNYYYTYKEISISGAVVKNMKIPYNEELSIYHDRISYTVSVSEIDFDPNVNVDTHFQWENVNGTLQTKVDYGTPLSMVKDDLNKMFGKSIKQPSEYGDTEYHFDGWFTSMSTSAEEWNPATGGNNGTEETMPAYPYQIFAHWTAPQHTVTFKVNPKNNADLKNLAYTVGGTFAEVTTENGQEVIKVNVEHTKTLEGVPQVTNAPNGTKLLYWVYESNDEMNGQRFVSSTEINKDITLTASWSVDNQIAYDVICKDKTTGKQIKKETRIAERDVYTTVAAPVVKGMIVAEGEESTVRKIMTDEDHTVTFLYSDASNTWTYTVKKYVRYQNADGSKVIDILVSSEEQKTTNRQEIVQATNLTNYEFMPSVSNVQQALTHTVDEDHPVASFYYQLSDFNKSRLATLSDDMMGNEHLYDGSGHGFETTINNSYLQLKDIETGAEYVVNNKIKYVNIATGETLAENAEPKDVGTYLATVRVVLTNKNNANDYVQIAETGSINLTINKRSIVITSKDHQWTYDGNQHSENDYEVTGDGFAEGEGVDLTFLNTITEPGRLNNAFTVKAKEGTATKLTNYSIDSEYGVLSIIWKVKVEHVLELVTATDEDHPRAVIHLIVNKNEDGTETLTLAPNSDSVEAEVLDTNEDYTAQALELGEGKLGEGLELVDATAQDPKTPVAIKYNQTTGDNFRVEEDGTKVYTFNYRLEKGFTLKPAIDENKELVFKGAVTKVMKSWMDKIVAYLNSQTEVTYNNGTLTTTVYTWKQENQTAESTAPETDSQGTDTDPSAADEGSTPAGDSQTDENTFSIYIEKTVTTYMGIDQEPEDEEAQKAAIAEAIEAGRVNEPVVTRWVLVNQSQTTETADAGDTPAAGDTSAAGDTATP